MIASLPDIDWDKYSAVGVQQRSSSRKAGTRNKTSSEVNSGGEVVDSGVRGGQMLVRGRPFEEGKPRTFNQPWTAEEQQRLEELLMQYPSEDVEMER